MPGPHGRNDGGKGLALRIGKLGRRLKRPCSAAVDRLHMRVAGGAAYFPRESGWRRLGGRCPGSLVRLRAGENREASGFFTNNYNFAAPPRSKKWGGQTEITCPPVFRKASNPVR